MEEKKTKEPQYNEPKMMLHLAIYSAVGKYWRKDCMGIDCEEGNRERACCNDELFVTPVDCR